MMRRFLGLALSLALGLTALAAVPAVAQSDNSRLNIGDEETTYLQFATADEVKTIVVSIPDGKDGDARNGRLTVETQDGFCCEDYWGIRIIKHNGRVMDEAVGDGSGVGNVSPQPDDWSGAATIPALPTKAVTVEVYYDSGSDVFPAGMWVRALFDGEEIELAPVP